MSFYTGDGQKVMEPDNLRPWTFTFICGMVIRLSGFLSSILSSRSLRSSEMLVLPETQKPSQAWVGQAGALKGLQGSLGDDWRRSLKMTYC